MATLWFLLVLLFVPAEAERWPSLLPGRWIGVEKGDAVKDGRLVEGGIRVVFVEGQRGSRTPWNLSFIAPREGHRGSDTVSGGCGFYPSGTAFCRGYGISPAGKAMETSIVIEPLGDDRLRLSIHGLLAPIEIRKP